MADTVKISALPVATTVSSGDVLPIVQGGITKQVDVTDMLDAVNSLTTATTVSGGEYLPVIQGGVAKKLDVLDIFDTVSVPGDEGLIGAWTGREVPEIPDAAAGTLYKSKSDWIDDTDGWIGYHCAVAISGGELVITANDTSPVIHKLTGSTLNRTLKLKIRNPGDYLMSWYDGSAYNFMTLLSDDGTYQIWQYTNTTSSATETYFKIHNAPNGYVAYVDWIYVGTGQYATPNADESGHGMHLTVFGETPDGDGNLIRDGVNDYERTTSVLASVPDVWHYHEEMPSGNAQLATVQTLFDYKAQSTTIGYGWLYRNASSDNLVFAYCTGSGVAYITITGYFTGYSAIRLVLDITINWITGVVTVYRNGVYFGTAAMTTPVKPTAGSYLYFGAYQGTTYFAAGTFGAKYLYDRALSLTEIRGLYLNLEPPLPHKLIDWQFSYMTNSTITTSSFAITAASGYVIPQGKYEFSATSPLVQLQFLSGASWYGASYLSGQVCADGVNVRAYNPTASGVTVYYRKLDV